LYRQADRWDKADVSQWCRDLFRSFLEAIIEAAAVLYSTRFGAVL
jgi:hypothetical protein